MNTSLQISILNVMKNLKITTITFMIITALSANFWQWHALKSNEISKYIIMKKITLILLLAFASYFGHTQVTMVSGSTMNVDAGTTIIIEGFLTTTNTNLINEGTVLLEGDLENNTSDLFDASSSGTFTFGGSSAQEITGDNDVGFYGTVDIDNSNGVSITSTSTGADQTINGTLNFTSGLLTLNAFDILIGSTDPTNTTTAKYLQTNSTGVVNRSVPADGSTDVTFPVGNSAYNPIILKNSATATTDVYGVMVTDSKPASFTGTTHIVDRSWEISESVADDSDLTITTQWNDSEELTSFDETKSCVGVTTNAGATVSWGTSGSATGSDPYVRSQSGYTSVGAFMVGDYYYSGIEIDLQLFLAAAYNTTNLNMDKALNDASLLPTTDPYGLSTTVSSIPSTAVDWIKIELRDANDNTTVLYSFARFINQSGQVIEEDDSNFNMKGVTSGSYYIAVHHRNHFAVVSSSTVDLSSSPTLSFITAQATAYQDVTITTNEAMKQVEDGDWALWDGDANADGSIKYNGTSNDKNEILGIVGLSTPNTIVSSYSDSDLNMDGEVKYNGTSNDKNEILGIVGLSTPNDIKTEHLPN